jgi:hypothetical protein
MRAHTHIMCVTNKPDYVVDAIASVEAQTSPEWDLHLIHSEDRDWGGRYPPAVWFNECLEKISLRDYVCWLSDDDLKLPNFVADLGGYLDSHPDVGACYGPICWAIYEAGVGYTAHDVGRFPIGGLKRQFDRATSPYCKLDAGQVLMRRSIFQKISKPWWPEEMESFNTSDGRLFVKVAEVTPIVLATEELVCENRTTPLSRSWRWFPKTQELKYVHSGEKHPWQQRKVR